MSVVDVAQTAAILFLAVSVIALGYALGQLRRAILPPRPRPPVDADEVESEERMFNDRPST